MSELTKQLVWPLSIKPVNDLSNAPKSGVLTAKYKTGAEIRRTYQNKGLVSFSAKFFLSPLHDSYEDDTVWFASIENMLDSFLFMDPHQGYWLQDVIGVADGIQTTWVLPYLNWLGIPTVYEDGVLSSANSLYYDGPNLVNFNQSLFNFDSMDLAEVTAPQATASKDYNVANGRYNRPATETTSTSPLTSSTIVAYVNIPLANGESVNILIDFIGKATTDGAAISNVAAAPLSPLTNEWDSKSVLFTSTGSTVVTYAGGTVSLAGLGDTAYFGALALTRGDLDTWYPGSLRMPTVVFDTAPAKGTVITSQIQKANRMLRMVCRSITHAIQPDGNRFITVKMDEVAE